MKMRYGEFKVGKYEISVRCLGTDHVDASPTKGRLDS